MNVVCWGDTMTLYNDQTLGFSSHRSTDQHITHGLKEAEMCWLESARFCCVSSMHFTFYFTKQKPFQGTLEAPSDFNPLNTLLFMWLWRWVQIPSLVPSSGETLRQFRVKDGKPQKSSQTSHATLTPESLLCVCDACISEASKWSTWSKPVVHNILHAINVWTISQKASKKPLSLTVQTSSFSSCFTCLSAGESLLIIIK